MIERLYEALEYEAALATLDKASSWSGNGRAEIVWLCLIEGHLQFQLRSNEKALLAFKRALALDANAQPLETGSRALTRLFEQARKELGLPPPALPPPHGTASATAPPVEEPAPAPSLSPKPVQTAVEAPHLARLAFARWSIALRGQYWPLETAPARGGTVSLLAGMALTSNFTLNMGPMASVSSLGGLVRAGWIPLNADRNLRPVVALEVPILITYENRSLTTGVGLSLGLEYLPIPWLFVAVDVPVYFLPVIPTGNSNVWVFGSISAGVRL